MSLQHIKEEALAEWDEYDVKTADYPNRTLAFLLKQMKKAFLKGDEQGWNDGYKQGRESILKLADGVTYTNEKGDLAEVREDLLNYEKLLKNIDNQP